MTVNFRDPYNLTLAGKTLSFDSYAVVLDTILGSLHITISLSRKWTLYVHCTVELTASTDIEILWAQSSIVAQYLLYNMKG